jgi:uracil-DNA glycosylase family 4
LRGFFSQKEIRPKKELDRCDQCGLDQTCQAPKTQPSGLGKKQILVQAEANGKTEDDYIEYNKNKEIIRKGKALIGKAGSLFRDHCLLLDIDVEKDCWVSNSLLCRPPGNRTPSKKELKLCKPNTDKIIRELNPKFIWLLGGSAVESFYMDRFSDLSITRWRKRCIPDYNVNAFIIPLYHPSYILRNSTDDRLQKVFMSDLKFAVDCLNKEFPKKFNIENRVVTFSKDQFRNLIHILNMAYDENKPIYFDYETNAINPHKVVPKIWSISFSFDGEKAYSFPLDYPNIWTEGQKRNIESCWKQILEKQEKIAHNLKFEDRWSRARFSTVPQGWIWDTMVTQHVLDDRAKTTSLKFQSYVRWGIEGYEKDFNKYLKKDQEENNLYEMPLEGLLTYNALDSLLGYKLYKEQSEEIKRPRFLQRGNKLFLDGTLAFCDIEENGICIDTNHYQKEDKRLEKEIQELEKTLNGSREAKLFTKRYNEDIKLNSPDHIRKLLFEILKIDSLKKTNTQLEAVDKEVLEKIDLPFANDLVKLRKLEKIKGTYLAQFSREVCPNKKLYPYFNLNFVQTYRSSSSNPNFQNIPVRDEEAKAVTRKGIIPSPGNKILEVDYGAMEVRIIACHSKDKELIKRIDDPHYEWAKNLFILNDDEMTKDIRFYAKNQFVFPEFYGSWFKACARNLWETCKDIKNKKEISLSSHLVSSGLLTNKEVKNLYFSEDPKILNPFEDHIKQVEKKFWDLFWETREWQKKIINDYLKTGWIELITGFYRQGYLSKNQIINTPIQGAAFHCLLWSLIQINKEMKKRKTKTKIIGQIHDSAVNNLHPPEEKEIIDMYKYYMTEKIREEWSWIIIPLLTEFEITEIDQPWYYKKEVKV